MTHEAGLIELNDREFVALQKEDDEFPGWDDLFGLNRSESRDTHHQQLPRWAGELQKMFGTHRRGPPARDW